MLISVIIKISAKVTIIHLYEYKHLITQVIRPQLYYEMVLGEENVTECKVYILPDRITFSQTKIRDYVSINI